MNTNNNGRANGRSGFTLIELLVVISIIAVIAAMIFPITGAVKRAQTQARAKLELAEVGTAIELYKAKLGHYPPDARQDANSPLYFELLGTTNTGAVYITLDGSAQIPVAGPNGISTIFPPLTGFINCTQPGGGDETRRAVPFLRNLRQGRYAQVGDQARVLTCSIPFDPAVPGPNPIHYNSSNPTNNPNSFDLWVDIIISHKTNRVSNWSAKPIILK